MEYVETFTDQELDRIIEEATIYMCACPAQVADALRQLRALYRYQQRCLLGPDTTPEVHERIALSTVRAHAELQQCLDDVLTLEQWDRSTLRMPPGLRQRQHREVFNS